MPKAPGASAAANVARRAVTHACPNVTQTSVPAACFARWSEAECLPRAQMGHEALFSQTGVDIVTGQESKVRRPTCPSMCTGLHVRERTHLVPPDRNAVTRHTAARALVRCGHN